MKFNNDEKAIFIGGGDGSGSNYSKLYEYSSKNGKFVSKKETLFYNNSNLF